MFLSQEQYVVDLLTVAGMENNSSVNTPLPLQLNNVPDQDTPFSDPYYFRSLVGKLQYLTLTRPDIQFAVNYVCQNMHAHTVSDFTNLKRILRYVKGTMSMGLSFLNVTDCTLRAYSDWAGCSSTRRSTGGFCTFLGQNLISWSSQKQPTVSKSSTEAEYRTLSETALELAWISHLLNELGISLPMTPELFGDNLSSIYLTASPAFHKRTKHFETDYHYVRERVALGSLVVRHILARLQLADIFMKSLPTASFQSLRFKLGLDILPTHSLRGAINTSSNSQNMVEPKLVRAHTNKPT